MTERLVSGASQGEDDALDYSLRPRQLTDFVGQESVKDNLNIAMQAARMRGDPLDHVIIYGPPGLGKTTLAHIIAQEMSVSIKVTSGPAIERAGDMAAILTSLNTGDVLFIDEIHRLSRVVEEVLYPAMEDFFLSWVVGKGAGSAQHQLAHQLIHVDRRHHPVRHGQPAPAGPVRLGVPAGLLRQACHGVHSGPLGSHTGRGHRPGRGVDHSGEVPAARPVWPTGCSSVRGTMHR